MVSKSFYPLCPKEIAGNEVAKESSSYSRQLLAAHPDEELLVSKNKL